MPNTKDDLRPCSFMKENSGRTEIGWFHKWIEIRYSGDVDNWALVESKEGNIYKAYFDSIIFLDR